MQYDELMDKVIDQAYDEIEQSGRSAFDYINAMNNFQLIEFILRALCDDRVKTISKRG